MKKYVIICSTDPFNASRDARFNMPKAYPRFKENDSRFVRSIIIEECTTLKQAQQMLTSMFIVSNKGGSKNWGLNVIHTNDDNDHDCVALPTHEDGTRAFTQDIYTYSIEVVDNEE